jgi:hypothetical protein
MRAVEDIEIVMTNHKAQMTNEIPITNFKNLSFNIRNLIILLRRKPRAFKPGDECAGCSRSIMRPMGFLLRRIPPSFDRLRVSS